MQVCFIRETSQAAPKSEAVAYPIIDPWQGKASKVRGIHQIFKKMRSISEFGIIPRTGAWAFQTEIDATIDQLIEAFEVQVIPLDPSDRDGWIPAVMGALELPLKQPQIDLFGASAVGG